MDDSESACDRESVIDGGLSHIDRRSYGPKGMTRRAFFAASAKTLLTAAGGVTLVSLFPSIAEAYDCTEQNNTCSYKVNTCGVAGNPVNTCGSGTTIYENTCRTTSGGNVCAGIGTNTCATAGETGNVCNEGAANHCTIPGAGPGVANSCSVTQNICTPEAADSCAPESAHA